MNPHEHRSFQAFEKGGERGITLGITKTVPTSSSTTIKYDEGFLAVLSVVSAASWTARDRLSKMTAYNFAPTI